MKVAHPKLLVQSTFVVVPTIRQPIGLPLRRVAVRPVDIAPAPEANRQV